MRRSESPKQSLYRWVNRYEELDETGRCEKFQIRENPKPYKSGNILCHGLLTCKKCYSVWNRDVKVEKPKKEKIKKDVQKKAKKSVKVDALTKS